jgi:hypothetical protein
MHERLFCISLQASDFGFRAVISSSASKILTLGFFVIVKQPEAHRT